jgi:hypothetical protein
MKSTQAPRSFLVLLLSLGIAGPKTVWSSDFPRPSHALSQATAPNPGRRARLVQSSGRMCLSFEANLGQTDGRVRFLARVAGYTIFLTDDEAVLVLKKRSVVSGESSVAGNRLSSSPRTYTLNVQGTAIAGTGALSHYVTLTLIVS